MAILGDDLFERLRWNNLIKSEKIKEALSDLKEQRIINNFLYLNGKFHIVIVRNGKHKIVDFYAIDCNITAIDSKEEINKKIRSFLEKYC